MSSDSEDLATKKERIKARLRELAADNRPRAERHIEADDLLCELLAALGHEDVVREWTEVERWYE